MLRTIVAFLLLTPCAALGQTFHEYDCTEDCSGHEAGYEWAEDNDITDPDDCGGNSQSFIEGCEAWAEENAPDEGWNEDEDCWDEDEDGECD